MNQYLIYSYIEDYSDTVQMFQSLLNMDSTKNERMDKIIELEGQIELVNRGIEMVELSPLEETILCCRMDGMNVTNISRHLCIARNTVRKHMDNASKAISEELNRLN